MFSHLKQMDLNSGATIRACEGKLAVIFDLFSGLKQRILRKREILLKMLAEPCLSRIPFRAIYSMP
jgi:hypothetical protein